MRVIIAGGRDYTPTQIEKAQVIRALWQSKCTEIVSGGATGVDAWAEKLASELDLPSTVFKADWKTYGRAAGPLRNKDMACYADACILLPGGRGTTSMKREALQEGLPILLDLHSNRICSLKA